MPQTPNKMHMFDMVKIDTTVFEIVRGGGAFKEMTFKVLLKPPPPRIVSCLKYPARIGLTEDVVEVLNYVVSVI